MNRVSLIIMLILSLACSSRLQAKTTVSSLRCEYRENPIGLDTERPRLSWKLFSDERSVMQSAYEICAATSYKELNTKNALWSTGKVESGESIQIEYGGRAPKSGERIYWRVRVWDNQGRCSKWSDVAYWEAGIMDNSEWDAAEWITVADEGEITSSLPSQYYRKEFNLNKKIKRARVYVTSLGTYQLFLNGAKVSDDLFAPGWTSYHKRLQYQTYDVTEMLKSSDNCIGAMVGDGWYRGRMAWQNDRAFYGDQLALLLKLKIEYTDDSEDIIISDDSWSYNYGAIIYSDWYDGEYYDARKELANWENAGYDSNAWKKVETLDYPKNHLVSTTVELPQVIEHIKPIKMFVTPKGEYVADLGQNIVGWARLQHQGAAGDKVTITFAEVLDQDGNFYNANYRSAKATDTFILKGGSIETLEPHFTFHGFRYIKFEGVDKMPSAEDVRGVVIHTPMEMRGEFTTSNPLINQLQSNILWSHRDNFLDIPTDCPQRDERLGWTGDAQVFSMTASFNYDVANFFTKWLRDLAADQREDGSIPHVIPDVLPRAGSAAWADAAIIIPWNLYHNYGDIRILEEQYDSMVAWIGYMENKAGDSFEWNGDFHYGDWLSNPAAITDKDLIANAYFYYGTTLVKRVAEILGKSEDVKRLDDLAANVKRVFNANYVTPSGRMVSDTQTAYLMALSFNLIPQSLREAAKRLLTENVSRFKYLTTGFVGTSLLCNTLTDINRDDLAFMLLMRKEFPSWLYPVTMGATTIWERWDALLPDGAFNNGTMNSFNHYSYGAIGEWMYKNVAGINNDNIAYKSITLSPKVGGDFTSAAAKHESMYGEIISDWKIVDGQFIYKVSIPANTTATVILPNANSEEIEIDFTIDKVQEGQNVKFALGSGNYNISYPYNGAM